MAHLLAEGQHGDPPWVGGYSPWPLSPLLCLLDPYGLKDPKEGKSVGGALGVRRPVEVGGGLWGSVGTCWGVWGSQGWSQVSQEAGLTYPLARGAGGARFPRSSRRTLRILNSASIV